MKIIPDTDVYYLLRMRDDDAGHEKLPQELVLMGGVSLAQRAETAPPDMGWCLLEPFMGCGYAAEAGKEVLRMAREVLGIKDIIAWPGVGNERSLKTARKIGFVEGGNVRTETGNGNEEVSVVFVMPGMAFDGGMKLALWGEGGRGE